MLYHLINWLKVFFSSLRSDLSGLTSQAINKKCPWLPAPSCNNRGRFRSHDGTCNNLREPNFGRMGTPFNRIMLPEYAGGSSSLPRKRPADGFELPSARRISAQLTTGSNNADSANTLMVMQFGQFVDHDITHTPAHSVSCCTRNICIYQRTFTCELFCRFFMSVYQ